MATKFSKIKTVRFSPTDARKLRANGRYEEERIVNHFAHVGCESSYVCYDLKNRGMELEFSPPVDKAVLGAVLVEIGVRGVVVEGVL